MKNTWFWSAILIILVSCSDKKEKKNTIEKIQPVYGEDGISLKQNANYDQLYTAAVSGCPLLTPAEIAKELGLPAENVSNTTTSNRCYNEISMEDGTKYSAIISPGIMKKEAVIKEIKKYKQIHTTENPLYEISDTGDNYICYQKSHARVFLYNPGYDGYVVININSVHYLIKDATPLSIRKEHAFKLANALLRKYGKPQQGGKGV